MCGIAGQFRWTHTVDPQQVEQMCDALVHRGPDDSGVYLNPTKTVGLGHRRLSILDTSSKGGQPMVTPDKQVALVFNGMISNYLELRGELLAAGYKFRGHSDTEVVLNAYMEWGLQCLQRFRGMFAIVIWDGRTKELFLARDHFGVKPLYYAHHGSGFYFASELKALYQVNDLPRHFSQTSARDFLMYRFVPGSATIWKNIHKIAPGEYIHVAAGGSGREPKVSKHKYWQLEPGSNRPDQRLVQQKAQQLLERSTINNLSSDVPHGLFLSGGFDSATLAYMVRKNGEDINTYSIGFEGWEKSEHHAAFDTASFLNTRHHNKILSVPVDGFFDEAGRLYDDPFGGSSLWPTSLLCQNARKHITVALGGDGGDEIFAGYNWYPGSEAEVGSEAGFDAALQTYTKAMNWSTLSGSEVADLLSLEKGDITQTGDLFSEQIDRRVGGVKAFQLLDFHTFLPDVVLAKVDRAAMATSMEVRVPYLDVDLVDFMMSLSPDRYLSEQKRKPLLGNMLPAELTQAIELRPKQGFSAPVGHYMEASALWKRLEASKLLSDGIVCAGTSRKLAGNNRFHALFALNVFASWYDKWG